MNSQHPIECQFQHFMSYSGFGALYEKLGRGSNDLRVAYYTGAGIDVTTVTNVSCPICDEKCPECGANGGVNHCVCGLGRDIVDTLFEEANSGFGSAAEPKS
jgi:hypothetical protein